MRHSLSVAICVIVSLVLLAVGTRYLRDIWIFATFHSVQIHLAALCLAAGLAAFLLHRNSIAPVLAIIALVFLAHGLWMAREFRHSIAPSDRHAPTLRLMSFNIMMSNGENAPAIVEAILASGADVVNIMESEPLIDHLEALSGTYPYRLGCGAGTQHCDLMMLSKLPLHAVGIHSLSDIFAERLMLARLDFAGQDIHIAAIHATKPYFDNFHRLEMIRAARLLAALDGPLILAGDFNASTLAPDMRMLLRRTGLASAGREPATWPVRAGLLGVAIDHVYARPPLAITTLDRPPDALGSNHYGLMAEIAVPDR